MIHGVEQILLKMTQADEFGIYRVTSSGDQLYVLSFDNQVEAEQVAQSLQTHKTAEGKLIKVVNHFPASQLKGFGQVINLTGVRSGRSTGNTKNMKPVKRKNVRGVVQKCQELLYDGKSIKEVVEKLLPLYLEADRSVEFGTKRITETCKEIQNH
jgi:hypothetical protein